MIEITAEEFPSKVLQADVPVLVDFWGPRCQPCLALMPAVEALADEVSGQMRVVKMNANARANWPVVREYGVMGLPAYLLFQNGEEVRRLTGKNVTRDTLAAVVEQLIVVEW
ncbi:MAG TPA: thiol reductase thioredoxin [Chloroflexi bacterium]|nr:thiol reductase thioredoxin [Chloroflexota bacterium]